MAKSIVPADTGDGKGARRWFGKAA
jgi:hypothetical protein